MEGELIIVAFISTCGTIIGLQMMMRNWIKKQEVKYKYDVKKVKLRNKAKARLQEQQMPPASNSSGLLSLLGSLDPDTVGALKDKFLDDAEQSGTLTDTLLGFAEENPELVKSFLSGLSQKNKNEEGNTGLY